MAAVSPEQKPIKNGAKGSDPVKNKNQTKPRAGRRPAGYLYTCPVFLRAVALLSFRALFLNRSGRSEDRGTHPEILLWIFLLGIHKYFPWTREGALGDLLESAENYKFG